MASPQCVIHVFRIPLLVLSQIAPPSTEYLVVGNEHTKDSMCVFDYPFSLPADPSLTVENMYEVLKGVDLGFFHWAFEIPNYISEFNRVSCKEYLDAHPAPSWAHIAEGLFLSYNHNVLKQLERQHPIGM